MSNPYRREKIENWAGEFAQSDRGAAFSEETRAHASAILTDFLEGACHGRDVEPDEIEEHDIRHALLDHVARLSLPPAVRTEAPRLCAAFLEQLEDDGRVGGGSGMAALTRALAPAFEDQASGRSRPIVNRASKLGRNDPCPCGSGKKFKKCCMQ